MPHDPEYLFQQDPEEKQPCENYGCPVEDILDGDDPGFVQGDLHWIAVCSEACTDAVLAQLKADDDAAAPGSAFRGVVTTDAPQYEWTCAHTITCDPLLDRHGWECDQINQHAREEFYADLIRSTTIGDLL